MKRRDLLLAAGLAPISRAFGQAKPVKIGILLARQPSFYAPGIIQRLAELGDREGVSVQLMQRSADGDPEKFPALARELIAAKCDVIFAVGPEHAVRALQNA